MSVLYAYTCVVNGRKLVHGNDVWRGKRFVSMGKLCVCMMVGCITTFSWNNLAGERVITWRWVYVQVTTWVGWATRHMLVYAYMESVGMCGQHTDAGDAT